MNSNKNNFKLYNIIFPFWMLLLFPQVWIIAIPGNFIIDSLVLIISMSVLKICDRMQFYKKHILKVFLFGFASDIIGSVYMFLMFLLRFSTRGDELYLTIPALIISAVLIYYFNYLVTFKKLESNLRFKISLIYAVATAPYTFLIPTSWLY